MAILRNKSQQGFTIVDNYALKDGRISLKARGLLATMLSLPDGWDFTEAGIVAIVKDGRASVRSGLAELEDYGYLTRELVRNENGQFVDMVWEIRAVPAALPKKSISDDPIFGDPISGDPISENRISENQSQLNTYSIKNETNQTTNELNNGGHADAAPSPQAEQPAVKRSTRFKPPTVQEVADYCRDKGYEFDPEQFVAYYESVGWRVGNRPMKNWRAACVTWQKRQQSQAPNSNYSRPSNPAPKTVRSGSYDIDLDQYRGKSIKLSEYAARLAAEAKEKETQNA